MVLNPDLEAVAATARPVIQAMAQHYRGHSTPISGDRTTRWAK